MRKWKIQTNSAGSYKNDRTRILLTVVLMLGILAVGCGKTEQTKNKSTAQETLNQTENIADENVNVENATDENTQNAENVNFWEKESAADGKIDFAALQQENPDVFAWLYVPGTNIDVPILQSGKKDDYYKTHTIDGTESDAGAPYTEMANLMNMCDFNTIIHAKDLEEDDWFYELHQFENPDFFEENMVFYIYLPDNVLTYEIAAAYYDEDSDILRRYDYTTYDGCSRYLEQMKGQRDMGKQMREGVEITPYHYLVTLDGSIHNEKATQYVVIGILVNDAAGTIERIIWD